MLNVFFTNSYEFTNLWETIIRSVWRLSVAWSWICFCNSSNDNSRSKRLWQNIYGATKYIWYKLTVQIYERASFIYQNLFSMWQLSFFYDFWQCIGKTSDKIKWGVFWIGLVLWIFISNHMLLKFHWSLIFIKSVTFKSIKHLSMLILYMQYAQLLECTNWISWLSSTYPSSDVISIV